MQISATPLKWTIPFAANDSAKVEIPATTADPTRFSLSLGSPPLTGQPPESGGVPPQLEDFNGAVNQIARFTWWAMGGGPLPYDATWSADPNVNGYANGARIATADGRGEWISVVDNNTVNPDAVGTNWVPGSSYGNLALSGQTGGTVTLTPAQAIKRTLSVAGTLTSNLVIVMPTWLQEWTVTNTTTGAFTVTVKTAAGSGVVVPQDSSPTRVRGDGTNITQLAENIAAATASTHAMQLGQATGRLINTQIFTTNGTYTPTPGTNTIIVEGVGGGGGGGCPATTASQQATAQGGLAGGYARALYTIDANFLAGSAVTIGAGGSRGPAASGASGNGGSGGNTVLGTRFVTPGGTGGGGGTAAAFATSNLGVNRVLGTGPTITAGTLLNFLNPAAPIGQFVFSLTVISGGPGGDSPFGRGAASSTGGPGSPGLGYGGGGSGCAQGPSSAGDLGGLGANGLLIIFEYS